jgi:hypothetical protein
MAPHLAAMSGAKQTMNSWISFLSVCPFFRVFRVFRGPFLPKFKSATAFLWALTFSAAAFAADEPPRWPFGITPYGEPLVRIPLAAFPQSEFAGGISLQQQLVFDGRRYISRMVIPEIESYLISAGIRQFEWQRLGGAMAHLELGKPTPLGNRTWMLTKLPPATYRVASTDGAERYDYTHCVLVSALVAGREYRFECEGDLLVRIVRTSPAPDEEILNIEYGNEPRSEAYPNRLTGDNKGDGAAADHATPVVKRNRNQSSVFSVSSCANPKSAEISAESSRPEIESDGRITMRLRIGEKNFRFQYGDDLALLTCSNESATGTPVAFGYRDGLLTDVFTGSKKRIFAWGQPIFSEYSCAAEDIPPTVIANDRFAFRTVLESRKLTIRFRALDDTVRGDWVWYAGSERLQIRFLRGNRSLLDAK